MDPELNQTGEDDVSPMAFVLSGMPEVWQRLLDDHVPNGSGRCTACRKNGTAGVPWPCTLQVIAADAKAIHQTSPVPEPDVPAEFPVPAEAGTGSVEAARCGLAC